MKFIKQGIPAIFQQILKNVPFYQNQRAWRPVLECAGFII